MNEIKRVLKIAAWRLFVLDLSAGWRSAPPREILAYRTAAVQRVLGWDGRGPGLVRIGSAAAGGGVVGRSCGARSPRPGAGSVARELEERANLVSNWHRAVSGQEERGRDAWARVSSEDARQKDVSVRVNSGNPLHRAQRSGAAMRMARRS